MVDTPRTLVALQALLADNKAGEDVTLPCIVWYYVDTP